MPKPPTNISTARPRNEQASSRRMPGSLAGAPCVRTGPAVPERVRDGNWLDIYNRIGYTAARWVTSSATGARGRTAKAPASCAHAAGASQGAQQPRRRTGPGHHPVRDDRLASPLSSQCLRARVDPGFTARVVTAPRPIATSSHAHPSPRVRKARRRPHRCCDARAAPRREIQHPTGNPGGCVRVPAIDSAAAPARRQAAPWYYSAASSS